MPQRTQRTIMNAKDEAASRRRGRSWAILIVLIGLCVLFYAITIVKMTHH
jgi:hypothetical protein